MAGKSNLRIVLLDFGTELRGGQLQVLYLARALHRLYWQGESIQVWVSCPKGSALARKLEQEQLPCLLLPGHRLYNPFLWCSLLWDLHRNAISILHTHDAQAALAGWCCKRLIPALTLIHSRRVSYPIGPGLRGRKYMLADAVIGVSRAIAQALIRRGVPEEKVYAIHSGIDPLVYPHKIPSTPSRFVFGAVGALTPQKGFDVLIRAMAELAARDDMPPWEVRIVGAGPLFTPLLHLAEQLHVAERLAMFGRQDSKVFLPDFDVLIVPSTDGEGSSAVIKEGWVVGVPVVCSALPSNQELITDGRNGMIVPVGDAAALAAMMRRLLREPDLREQLIASGRQSVPSFTAGRMAEKTLALYRKLVA
jgi:glycosyltransferase involved in cell wall biosynthesis